MTGTLSLIDSALSRSGRKVAGYSKRLFMLEITLTLTLSPPSDISLPVTELMVCIILSILPFDTTHVCQQSRMSYYSCSQKLPATIPIAGAVAPGIT